MKVIFFKVEGLLNNPESDARAPSGQIGVATPCLKVFKRITPGSQIVLIGQWTKDWDFDDAKCTKDGAYLNRKLDREGLHIMTKTDDIQSWLSRHTNVTEYCVLSSLDSITWEKREQA